MRFSDRVQAGRRLAAELQQHHFGDAVVIGLPRGGVPVAYEVALKLGLPLDITVVRKLGVPFQHELGLGAIGEGGVRVLNDRVVQQARIDAEHIAAITDRERITLERQARRFRAGRASVRLDGRTAIVVDDGIATGATARAACQAVRARGANRIVLATPVAPAGLGEVVRADADDVICLRESARFFAVGEFYRHFDQVPDERVTELLERAGARERQHPVEQPVVDVGPQHRDDDVSIPSGTTRLAGHLHVPERARGLVLFAHGSGSSRHSPRNRHVAAALNANELGTLLVDLLTVEEETDRGNVFDIRLLANRLTDVTNWLRTAPETSQLPIGYFGASTGAAAALWAAGAPDSPVAAVVSRGGRPDLAIPRLALVRAPTLLIVGGADEVVLHLNRIAKSHLRCENRLEIVPEATHLFEEPGALEAVSWLAVDWFTIHFVPAQAGRD